MSMNTVPPATMTAMQRGQSALHVTLTVISLHSVAVVLVSVLLTLGKYYFQAKKILLTHYSLQQHLMSTNLFGRNYSYAEALKYLT